MRHKTVRVITAVMAAGLLFVSSVHAEPTQGDLEKLAAQMVAQFSTLYPSAPANDAEAHNRCAAGLRDASLIPFAPSGLLSGDDQPKRRLSKMHLTHFKPSIFQLMYLSLFTFTGRWSVDTAAHEDVGVVQLEAYFRNALDFGPGLSTRPSCDPVWCA